MTIDTFEYREHESGISGIIIAEKYSLEQMFQPEFSRPEPTGGRWWQFGPFGRGGVDRPRGTMRPGSGSWQKRQRPEE